MRWLDGYHQLDGQEIGQTPGDSEGQGGLACCSPGGCKESDTTERLNKNYHNSQSRNPSPTAPLPQKEFPDSPTLIFTKCFLRITLVSVSLGTTLPLLLIRQLLSSLEEGSLPFREGKGGKPLPPDYLPCCAVSSNLN